MGWREDVARVAALTDPQFMNVPRATAIGKLWETLRPKRILEIGTFKGRGACFLGAMASHYEGGVVTVDKPQAGQDGERWSVTAAEQVQRCGLDNVTVVLRKDGGEGWLQDHFLGGGKSLDFIYIDNGHQWLQTAAQALMSMAAVRPGGWLCFDDVRLDKYPAVGHVWEYLIPVLNTTTYEEAGLGFVMRP